MSSGLPSSPQEVLYALVAEAHNAALEAVGKCNEALELIEADDLRDQAERARDMLREAIDSLGFVAINVEVEA